MGTALVTGANRGIGLSLCKLLKARGDTVLAACRRSAPELTSLGVEVLEGVDVTSDKSVNLLAEKLRGKMLDLLVNNAGVLTDESLSDLDFAAIQRQMETNAYGPLRVTHKLLPQLKGGAKVALITSRMGSIADNTSGGMYGYRMSKAALNAAGKSHGSVRPEEAARDLLKRIDELALETTGTFWHANGQILPW
jgi:NAD(P)-dependent dehydrogenase (short-subunit alcohol dehydrogenase family)